MTDPADTDDLVQALRSVIVNSDRLRSSLAAQLGLNVNDLTALGHLAQADELTPKELSLRLEITTGSATGIVDRLEASGFLNRAAHATDRRSVMLRNTPAGSHAMQWVYEQYGAALTDALEQFPGLSAQQLTTVLRAAGRSIAMLRAEQPPAAPRRGRG